jgi:hypothetical protein
MIDLVQEQLVAPELREGFRADEPARAVVELKAWALEVDIQLPIVADDLSAPAGRALHAV